VAHSTDLYMNTIEMNLEQRRREARITLIFMVLAICINIAFSFVQLAIQVECKRIAHKFESDPTVHKCNPDDFSWYSTDWFGFHSVHQVFNTLPFISLFAYSLLLMPYVTVLCLVRNILRRNFSDLFDTIQWKFNIFSTLTISFIMVRVVCYYGVMFNFEEHGLHMYA
jgi:hypothetical protein